MDKGNLKRLLTSRRGFYEILFAKVENCIQILGRFPPQKFGHHVISFIIKASNCKTDWNNSHRARDICGGNRSNVWLHPFWLLHKVVYHKNCLQLNFAASPNRFLA